MAALDIGSFEGIDADAESDNDDSASHSTSPRVDAAGSDSANATTNSDTSVTLSSSYIPDVAVLPTHMDRRAVVGNTIGPFRLLSVIGRGAYGKVMLTELTNPPHTLFAMKIMKKHLLFDKNTVECAMAERTILSHITHPFIVHLYQAFQTSSKLYLILQYISGGELLHRLNELSAQSLSEPDTQFYAAELVCALEYLHARDIIYRDLKPENILLTSDGHVCLTDFGFAKDKMSNDALTRSFVGTLQYTAPEIILKTGHGKAADWWALGCLICEMLTGRTPYHNGNRQILQQLIVNGSLKLPSYLTAPAKHLITGLLRRPVHKRLEIVAAIRSHQFFRGIDWKKLEAKHLPPPFIPSTLITHDRDTVRFDATFTSEPVIDSPSSRVLGSPTNELFYGFSYNASPGMKARLAAHRSGHTTPFTSPLPSPTNSGSSRHITAMSGVLLPPPLSSTVSSTRLPLPFSPPKLGRSPININRAAIVLPAPPIQTTKIEIELKDQTIHIKETSNRAQMLASVSLAEITQSVALADSPSPLVTASAMTPSHSETTATVVRSTSSSSLSAQLAARKRANETPTTQQTAATPSHSHSTALPLPESESALKNVASLLPSAVGQTVGGAPIAPWAKPSPQPTSLRSAAIDIKSTPSPPSTSRVSQPISVPKMKTNKKTAWTKLF